MNDREIYIIGHQNPDTDSVCSAIAYADLKNKIGGKYIAGRCGNINNETKFVLDYFDVDEPELITDVRTQVKDIEIREANGVSSSLSLKMAWELMKRKNIVTIAQVDDENRLEGLITVSDIAKSCMEIYDSEVLARAETPYKNLVETLEGAMLTGDYGKVISQGRVLISTDVEFQKNDIVIANTFETQLNALQSDVQCIIICGLYSQVSDMILETARKKDCIVIKTDYDVYTAVKLINQSMPIGYFVRTHDLITFSPDDYLEDIRPIMVQKRHRDFPVIKKDGTLVGTISRRRLIAERKKRVILVDHNEKAQAADGIESAEIIEIIDHHRIADIETIKPVFFRNQPLGSTATIIKIMYNENNIPIPKKIAGLLCSAIISDTLILSSPTCTQLDRLAAHELADIAQIDIVEYSKKMFSAGGNTENKKIEDIFYQDFKMFSAGKINFGVGQFNIMDYNESKKLKEDILKYMIQICSEKKSDIIFFMLTNIIDKSSVLLFCGKGAFEYVSRIFHTPEAPNEIHIENLVSRKKQLVPILINALHTDLRNN